MDTFWETGKMRDNKLPPEFTGNRPARDWLLFLILGFGPITVVWLTLKIIGVSFGTIGIIIFALAMAAFAIYVWWPVIKTLPKELRNAYDAIRSFGRR